MKEKKCILIELGFMLLFLLFLGLLIYGMVGIAGACP